MDVWTIQLAKHRLLQGTDIELVNITLGSGIADFAPDRALLSGFKSGRITESEYKRIYKSLCWRRICTKPDAWLELIQRDRVALACYCPPDAFCHRLEILSPLEYLCRQEGIYFEYHGEIVL